MPIFSRRGSGPRIFFATDIHGSETCFRKFLNSAKFYEADVIVLGGDMTGKALVPIVGNGDGRYHCYLQDQRHEFGDDEVERYERMVRDRGLYPFRTTEPELAELRASPQRLEALDRQSILDVVQQWVDLADERLDQTKIRAFVCPGNDDMTEIDEILHNSKRLEVGEGRVIDLDHGFQLLSTGWANRTPWNTDREEDEDDMARRIEAMVSQATAPPEKLRSSPRISGSSGAAACWHTSAPPRSGTPSSRHSPCSASTGTFMRRAARPDSAGHCRSIQAAPMRPGISREP
jgi:uncharacterized protein